MSEELEQELEENCTEDNDLEEVQSELTLKEKVFLVCNNMQISGDKITRESVRIRTGGSDRDLSRYIKEWRESKALTVQNPEGSTISNGTISSKNLVQQNTQESTYSNTPNEDISQIARRAAERAAALIVGENAVVAHLLENPDQLPEDLKQQVEAYKSRINATVERRQEQYNPDFFAQAAIAQFQ
jgi:Plasmid replication region DNA-binding N-term